MSFWGIEMRVAMYFGHIATASEIETQLCNWYWPYRAFTSHSGCLLMVRMMPSSYLPVAKALGPYRRKLIISRHASRYQNPKPD